MQTCQSWPRATSQSQSTTTTFLLLIQSATLALYWTTKLNMKQHVNSIAKTCFYQLRRLRQVRRRAGYDVTVRLVLAVVMSRIDYCNVVLAAWSPSCDLYVFRKRWLGLFFSSDHVTTWRVRYSSCTGCPSVNESQYKLCVLMYAVHSGNSPAYTSDIVQSQRSASHRPGLRSADSNDYDVKPRLNTKFTERSFSYAGPLAWNQLPSFIRSTHNINSFKRQLTYWWT